jgi:hypothetical protein
LRSLDQQELDSAFQGLGRPVQEAPRQGNGDYVK